MQAVVKKAMKELARRRWEHKTDAERKTHMSNMGKASGIARNARNPKTPSQTILHASLPTPYIENLKADASFAQLGLPSGSRDRVRELVRIRDKRTCRSCGLQWKKGMRRLDVHHLDEDREGKSAQQGSATWDREHLHRMITLCHKCHLNLDTVKSKARRT